MGGQLRGVGEGFAVELRQLRNQGAGIGGRECHFGVLGAELRRAEADGYDTERLLRALVASRPLDDAGDVAAVLQGRVPRAAVRGSGPCRSSRRR